jgi:DNA polymerase-3 subunit delta
VILKSYIIEKDLTILNKYSSILAYGTNAGIKDDLKSKIRNNYKDVEIINLFEDFILKNKGIFYDTISNQSLFFDRKIIFINNASEKIFDILENHLKVKNVQIYIFSENLDKKSKLRKLFEKEKDLAIFACYEDNERSLSDYIKNELSEYKGLTGEICNFIISNCNTSRKEVQNEIEKIKILFSDKIIEKSKLFSLLNQKENTNFDEVRDRALAGEKSKLNKNLSEIDLLNEECFFYLNNLGFRIQRLIDIKNTINENKSSFELDDIDNIKPPIFWKDKPMFVSQLRNLSLKKLNEIYTKINTTEILMKKNSQINNAVLIKNLLIDIAK